MVAIPSDILTPPLPLVPQRAICTPLQFGMPLNWVVIGMLAAPNFLHAFIWFLPGAWRSTFRASAIRAYVSLSGLLLCSQAAMVLLWVWASRSQGLCFDTSKIQLSNWTLGVSALALGIGLQNGVLQSTGLEGLYYGSKLARKPGPSGWPFGLIPHPEYIGAALTVWSPVIMLFQQLPSTTPFLAVFWTTMFAFSWFMEDYL